MSRLRIILMALLVLISSLPLFPSGKVEAAESDTIAKKYSYPTGAWFEDGKLIFVTKNKKASSSIRYGTKAFVIRLDETCTDKKSIKKDTLGAECTPLSGDKDKDYIRIDLYKNNDFDKSMWEEPEDTGDCDYLHDYLAEKGINLTAKELWSMNECEQVEYGSSASESVLVAKFETNKEAFTNELVKREKFENIRDGATVFLNTIFLIKEGNNTLYDPEKKTLSEIRNARSWANKTYFRAYYDVNLEYKGSFPIIQKFVKESNQNETIKTDVQIKSKYGPEDDDGYGQYLWPAWKYDESMTLTGKPIEFEPTIKGKDGLTYFLKCSYVTRISEDPEESNCSKETDEPDWVRNSSTTIRKPPVPIKGVYVIGVYTLDPTCDCFTTATIPNKDKLEGEVPADNTKIGQKITMQVDLQQTDQMSIENWEKWVVGKSNFKIQIRTYRNDNYELSGLNNTGAAAIWSTNSNFTPDLDTTTPWNQAKAISVTKNDLLSLLKGNSGSKVLYYDDLTNYPIPEGGRVSFRYNADVRIWATDQSGTTVSKLCSRPKESTILTWFRPEPGEFGDFSSVPKVYSEIKEGSPQPSGTGSNETFDAMSGTPTTRSLYFASGGSEFIVDVQVEYVPKVTQTRSYKSEFISVPNGWAMEQKPGGWQNDSPPSKPEARVKIDACGAPYTENVTLEPGSYIKGTDSEGNPIEGQKYRWIQQGYPSTKVGGYTDTWTQTVTFDYMKINKAVVWKIERSKVDGMATLVGTNDITASITQGDPTFFYNRAASDTSAAGRLRYSVETDQHDSVYWSEGESDNCLTNSKDSGPKKEQAKFTERRNITGNVTAISDFLILQTSSGDQSVMYFEKPSNTAKVTEQLDVPITDFDTMWTNNPLSAAKWDKAATIKIGSYNGSFSTPTAKYSGGSTGTVATIFDSKPAGKNRTPRPSPYMRLMATNLDVPDTLSNGLYMTGTSTVFYRNVLNDNPKNKPTAYPVQSDATYGGTGLTFTSPYSPIHSKVNDVVIHDPVSVQHATVISLPSSLDQRTTPGGGNKQEGMAEYERVLDPNYRQNIIPNPDAEIINVDGTVAGWNKWVAKGSASNIAFTSRTGDTWVIGPGVHTFEINSVAVSGTNGGYWKDIPVKPNTVYKFEGDISCHRCEGYFALDFYDAGHQYAGVSAGSTDKVVNTGTVTRKSFTMTSPSNAAYLRIHMVKGDNKDTSHGRDHLFADNLSLKNMSLQEFVAVDSVEVTQVVPNPDYVAPQSGSTETFNFTGSTQYFTAPRDGTYTLEVWGAQGGYSNGGKGGYSKGSINLVAGQKIAVEVGGTNSYNGGGVSSGNGSGTITGGGATDIRTGSYSLSERIIVAGGGGGGGDASGGSGNNSAASYSLGSGQSYSHGCSNNVGPGGGGYYGGYSSTDGSSASSQGGSGYIGGVVGGIMQAGIRSGNGMAVITLPPVEEVGIPTKVITTTAGGSDTSPPSDAYILKAVTVNPNTPAGGYTPGNFVLLDYGFQLYFPNTGDFFGNGQWGWAQTTEIRGKGFTDGMDTTEWTKAKYVKFDFNVIYNNTMYKANEWIQLPVTSPGYLYDFYVPLANREKISAMVEWKSIAINSQIEDGDTPTNKVRYNAQRPYAAKHSTNKKYQVDVVGRIGNMVIEDTGDFRFSNLFKQPIDSTQWLVPKVVPQVNPNVQRWIIGDTVNIRGEPVSAGTRFLNTWGMLGHLEQNPIAFPLSPEKNSIPALRNQPLRFGYEVLSDIQTIGNYYSNMQITPYFYHVNLQNGGITPVDVYMNVDGMYKLINKNDGGQSAPDYANPVRLDWEAQDKRRNVTTNESDMTSTIAALFAQTGGDSAVGKAAEPSGSYMYGTSQLLELTGRNRTYIGRDATNGLNKNPGNRLAMLEYGMQAQRWHFSYVLPSSAVVVRKNQMPTQANIKALRNNTGVIVLAADIKAVGDTYTLQYKGSGNGSLNVAGVSWPLTGIPHPVIAVYSASKSSADDLKVSGTH